MGEKATIDKAVDVIKGRYAKDETDEFLKPIILCEEGRTRGNIFTSSEKDALLKSFVEFLLVVALMEGFIYYELFGFDFLLAE